MTKLHPEQDHSPAIVKLVGALIGRDFFIGVASVDIGRDSTRFPVERSAVSNLDDRTLETPCGLGLGFFEGTATPFLESEASECKSSAATTFESEPGILDLVPWISISRAKSATVTVMLSTAAFSASRRASAPDAQDFSSWNLFSAA